jgi:hypothetical protein
VVLLLLAGTATYCNYHLLLLLQLLLPALLLLSATTAELASFSRFFDELMAAAAAQDTQSTILSWQSSGDDALRTVVLERIKSCMAHYYLLWPGIALDLWLRWLPVLAAVAESIVYCSSKSLAAYTALSTCAIEKLEEQLMRAPLQSIIAALAVHVQQSLVEQPGNAAAGGNVHGDSLNKVQRKRIRKRFGRLRAKANKAEHLERTKLDRQHAAGVQRYGAGWREQSDAALRVRVYLRCVQYTAEHLLTILMQLRDAVLDVPVCSTLMSTVALYALRFEKVLYLRAYGLPQYCGVDVPAELEQLINARAVELFIDSEAADAVRETITAAAAGDSGSKSDASSSNSGAGNGSVELGVLETAAVTASSDAAAAAAADGTSKVCMTTHML